MNSDVKQVKKTIRSKRTKRQKKAGLFKNIFIFTRDRSTLFSCRNHNFCRFASSAPSIDDSKLKTPYSSKLYDKDKKVFAEVGAEKERMSR